MVAGTQNNRTELGAGWNRCRLVRLFQPVGMVVIQMMAFSGEGFLLEAIWLR